MRAFTLIELLIVVAIIAILAAIAVPNFLEAQTRAKVSRAKADMRSLTTALESYRIDWNQYPPVFNPSETGSFRTTAWMPFHSGRGPSVFGNGQGPNMEAVSARFIPLTTPVAYITSVFAEPFQVAGLAAAGAVSGDLPEFYDTFDYTIASDFLVAGDTRGSGITSGGAYHIVSVGPDRIQAYGGNTITGSTGPQSPNTLGCDYDPTNGTVSTGDVVRVGPGAPGEEAYYNRATGPYAR
ncbi:prepilin-type N-terminal cleavage/methylation domain-containing protein [Candidatus Sumerlaeota bacterium]|nr:prepilin-type N-terminal cleavage/methylation domain-containing protein [Candidatus Sumerlaeota bacterium]